MAAVATEEPGVGLPSEEFSSEQQLCQSGDTLVEWRSSEHIENGIPSTSPPYWDSSDDDDGGPKPPELYGKYTWKIEKFSTINKRELRSSAFAVGGYKWYILIYPQGCDVCNHLSLFLCVDSHDKLLPGWSHFAQFTIAVVNKDPKKSKYSDTLHRFWKKEHDWGWKKFMELSKMMDGFIDSDTLIIKAQVQVIRERADRPFRCLDCQYRRELVRVYLTNVEQICRRFVEERRGKLEKLIEDKARWASFRAFWLGMDQSSRRQLSREKTDSILKTVVKHFFIEKEVTSTLVMDSLYSGMKALEGQAKGKKNKLKSMESEVAVPVIHVEKETLVLEDDVLLLLERAAMEPLPPKDEKGPQNRTKDGVGGEEFNKDSIERDERRLTELGRRTIEIFVLAHIFSKIDVAYQEAISLKRQEELIREEEEAWLASIEQKLRRGALDKEKKSKKKQGKHKRNNRKGKDKGKEDKPDLSVLDKIEQDLPAVEIKYLMSEETTTIHEKLDIVEDNSDESDSAECIPELIQPELIEKDVSPINCGTDVVEVLSCSEVISNESNEPLHVHNGFEGISLSIVDDYSSTCSTDSVLTVVTRGTHNGNSRSLKINKHSTSGKSPPRKVTPERVDLLNEEDVRIIEASPDAGILNDASQIPKTAESTCRASVHCSQDSANMIEMHHGKEELHRYPGGKDAVAVDLYRDQTISPPMSPSRSISSIASPKLESTSKAAKNVVSGKKPSSDNFRQSDRSEHIATSSDISTTSKLDVSKKFTSPKPSIPGLQSPVVSEKPPTQHVRITTEKPSIPQMPVMSRPLSAPICHVPRPTASMVPITQISPAFARSVSATGRLGPEATTSSQNYVPQSYRNAIIGGHAAGNSSGYMQSHSVNSAVNASESSYSQAPSLVSAPLFLPHYSDRMSSNSRSSFPFGIPNHSNMLQNRPIQMESFRRDNCQNLSSRDSGSVLNDMQSYEIYEPVHHRSQEHLELPACTSGRQSRGLTDDFPHIDIINDLLSDEHGVGIESQMNPAYLNFSNVPHNLNRQFSFPGYPGMSGGVKQTSGSCVSERNQNYLDNGFQHGYGSFAGNIFDSGPQTCPQPYVNGQIDILVPNQWQISGSDLSYRNIRNTDNNGYPHHLPDVHNTIFHPSSGL